MTQFGQDFQMVIKEGLPNYVVAFYYRVMGYLKQKNYDCIMQNLKEFAAEKASLGENFDKYVVPFVWIVLAMVLSDLEKYAKAIKKLDAVVDCQEKMLGKKHPLLGVTLNNLAVVHVKEGKYEEVKNLANRALDIFEQSTSLGYSFVAIKLGDLARYFDNQGKHKEEERCYIRALEICEARQSSDDFSVAVATNELAQFYLKRGKLKDAEEHFKRVLSRACKQEFGDAGDKSS